MPGLSAFNYVLAVDERVIVRVRGTTIFLRSASGPLKIQPRSTQVGGGDGVAYSVTMAAAEKWFTAEEFDSIEIENVSTVQNTLELYIGFGDFFKPVPDVLNFSINVPGSQTILPSTDETNIDIGQAGKVSLWPLSTTRTLIIITALVTNTDPIRIGNTDVDTDNGIPLAPGETIALETAAQIFACSEAANDQGAAVTELRL